jgi:magnesium-transporting ATPase (P-type)
MGERPAAELGADVIMITGDRPNTAKSTAELDLIVSGRVSLDPSSRAHYLPLLPLDNERRFGGHRWSTIKPPDAPVHRLRSAVGT